MYDNIEKRGAIMNDNQFLGPKYVTTDSYRQIQEQILKYQQKQDEEVKNAVKAVHDLCIAVKKLDPQHQQQTFYLVLEEIAKQSGCNNR